MLPGNGAAGRAPHGQKADTMMKMRRNAFEDAQRSSHVYAAAFVASMMTDMPSASLAGCATVRGITVAIRFVRAHSSSLHLRTFRFLFLPSGMRS